MKNVVNIGEFFGVPVQCLTQFRIQSSYQIPGLYYYHIRAADEGGEPASLAKQVWVNHFGTLATFKPIESLEGNESIELVLSQEQIDWIYERISL
ncbi:LPD28 domain-containing protein [Peribacillus asahii]|uniref:LPD28 domain-containing protein n=1 Tax=Peribacillus asahii TaxID=228899 RepID=UPI0020798A1B|nr:LPD28 domain-containing protein [Peribacillus asahii]USK62288.1 hypothetical protein LIT37_24250 [Peribacillus asahii]